MRGFDLLETFNSNLEALLKNTRAKLKRVPKVTSENNNLKMRLTLVFDAMDNKTLCEYSAPTTANIRVGPVMDVGEYGFELKSGLNNMVHGNQFSGKSYEDASAHLQYFQEICSTFTIERDYSHFHL